MELTGKLLNKSPRVYEEIVEGITKEKEREESINIVVDYLVDKFNSLHDFDESEEYADYIGISRYEAEKFPPDYPYWSELRKIIARTLAKNALIVQIIVEEVEENSRIES